MLGINYASSDEEDLASATVSELIDVPKPNAPATIPLEQRKPDASATVNGPPQGPTVLAPEEDNGPVNSLPQASLRAMIQNLTLPTIPNFDLPVSPPGSPPLKVTKKFLQFLDLKKKRHHFNQRLEASSVLRDPGHLQRLMEFGNISVEDSHTNTLSEEVAMPVVFPEWAYVEELRASQKKILASREHEKSDKPREAVGFIPATNSGTSSGTRTPGEKGPMRKSGAD